MTILRVDFTIFDCFHMGPTCSFNGNILYELVSYHNNLLKCRNNETWELKYNEFDRLERYFVQPPRFLVIVMLLLPRSG
jgi:hypothetical protein